MNFLDGLDISVEFLLDVSDKFLLDISDEMNDKMGSPRQVGCPTSSEEPYSGLI